MIEVGIIGGAGYTAGELIRLLLNHPKARLNFVYSTSSSGQNLSTIHQDLVENQSLSFLIKLIQVLMFCFMFRHGNSKTFWKTIHFQIIQRLLI